MGGTEGTGRGDGMREREGREVSYKETIRFMGATHLAEVFGGDPVIVAAGQLVYEG